MIDLLPKDAVKNLKNVLSKKRYDHCVRVMETSFQIFDAWDMPDEKRKGMAWASLFHDCAKENPPKIQEKWIEKNASPYGIDVLDMPTLVHGTVGAIILKQEYGITDPEILMAVAYHSTGHPNLKPIGWIVYMADILEPGRTFIEKREDYLRTACKDPLEGLRQVTDLRHSINHGKGRNIHSTSIHFKEYLEAVESLDVYFESYIPA